jgi:hypothetical protein
VVLALDLGDDVEQLGVEGGSVGQAWSEPRAKRVMAGL